MSSNRKRLWILTLTLALPLLPLAVFAAAYQGGAYGGGRGRPMSPDEQAKQISKALDLTADQQSKLKPILVDQRKKVDDARNDSSLDRHAMRDKMMQIRQGTNDQIRALLDDKQKEKWDKLQQQREERMQNRRGRPAAPGGQDSGSNPPPPPPQN